MIFTPLTFLRKTMKKRKSSKGRETPKGKRGGEENKFYNRQFEITMLSS